MLKFLFKIALFLLAIPQNKLSHLENEDRQQNTLACEQYPSKISSEICSNSSKLLHMSWEEKRLILKVHNHLRIDLAKRKRVKVNLLSYDKEVEYMTEALLSPCKPKEFYEKCDKVTCGPNMQYCNSPCFGCWFTTNYADKNIFGDCRNKSLPKILESTEIKFLGCSKLKHLTGTTVVCNYCAEDYKQAIIFSKRQVAKFGVDVDHPKSENGNEPLDKVEGAFPKSYSTRSRTNQRNRDFHLSSHYNSVFDNMTWLSRSYSNWMRRKQAEHPDEFDAEGNWKKYSQYKYRSGAASADVEAKVDMTMDDDVGNGCRPVKQTDAEFQSIVLYIHMLFLITLL